MQCAICRQPMVLVWDEAMGETWRCNNDGNVTEVHFDGLEDMNHIHACDIAQEVAADYPEW
jgi:hypothetical protein